MVLHSFQPEASDDDELPLPVPLIIIIAISAAGILLICVLGTCNCVRNRRQNEKEEEGEYKHLTMRRTSASKLSYDEWSRQQQFSNPTFENAYTDIGGQTKDTTQNNEGQGKQQGSFIRPHIA
ncbi:uncharacterized protein LOC144620656 [Crassostrea virginica]